jgi:hypothetical protein
MSFRDASASEFVLRALIASEIAETCLEPALRSDFVALAGDWLARAAEASEDDQGSSDPSA